MTSNSRGRDAASPYAIPAVGWKDVLLRTWGETGKDNIGLIAAGVAFYAFLAIVPLIGAMVLSYGIVADPETVVRNVRSLTAVMPADAARLIGEQLMNVVAASGGKKGFGLLLALAIALYGAMKGAGAVVTALNVAYEQEETRGFVKLNLLALAITVGAVLLAIVATIAIAALGHLDDLFAGAPAALVILGKLLSYILMALAGAAAAATLYRYGPDRASARWVWLSVGSIAATVMWLGLTLGFGVYVANFGNYDATYGSLGAVVVLLTWIYLSAYVFLLGAELNSELERQTARDSTTGSEAPMGTRGAVVADTVADRPDHAPAEAAPSAIGPRSTRSSPAVIPTLAALKLGQRIGGRHGHMLATLLAGVGLAALGRPNRARAGAAMLAGGGLIAWLRRDRTD